MEQNVYIPEGTNEFATGDKNSYPVIQHAHPSSIYHSGTAIENGGYMMQDVSSGIKSSKSFGKIETIKHMSKKGEPQKSSQMATATEFEAVILGWSRFYSVNTFSASNPATGEIVRNTVKISGFISDKEVPSGISRDFDGNGFDLYIWVKGETETKNGLPVVRKLILRRFSASVGFEEIRTASNLRSEFLRNIGKESNSNLAPIYGVWARIGLYPPTNEVKSNTPFVATHPKIDVFVKSDGNITANLLTKDEFPIAAELYKNLSQENRSAPLSGVRIIKNGNIAPLIGNVVGLLRGPVDDVFYANEFNDGDNM